MVNVNRESFGSIGAAAAAAAGQAPGSIGDVARAALAAMPPSPPAGAGGGGGGGAPAPRGGGGSAAGGGGGGKTLLDDVFTVYKFWIEIESDLVAGFTEASGIQAEAEVFDWLEGGENTSVLKFPGRAKYGNITLKHGFTMSEKLWNSFKKTLRGEPERKTLTVIMFDTKGNRKRDWTFDRAFPVKWTGPALKANGNEIAIETVEFA